MPSTPMNRYWIPQLDIHKNVISQELQGHLGPDAAVKPYTYQDEDGFLITTPGPCLTDEQIEDIRLKSGEMSGQGPGKHRGNQHKLVQQPPHPPDSTSKMAEEYNWQQKKDDGRQSDSSCRQFRDRKPVMNDKVEGTGRTDKKFLVTANVELREPAKDLVAVNVREFATEQTAHFSTEDMDPKSFALWFKNSLLDNRNTSSSKKPKRSVTFLVNLESFFEFLDDEYPETSAGSVLTVTGSHQNAFADTAHCYTTWQWPKHGLHILNWLLTLRSHPSPCSVPQDVGDACISLQSSVENLSEVWILVAGPQQSISSIALQLAWTMTAFKKPTQGGVSLAKAKVHCHGLRKAPLKYAKAYPNFEITHRQLHGHTVVLEEKGTCWNNFFRHFSIATGFPIPPRPVNVLGVELPFPLMQALTQFDYPLPYLDGFVLKGRRTAVFPISISDHDDSVVQWHVIENASGSDLSMAEAHLTAQNLAILPITGALDQCIDLVLSTDRRHFLGLYQDARIHLGTDDSQAEEILSVDGDPAVRALSGKQIQWQRTISPSISVSALAVSVGASSEFRFGRSVQQALDIAREPQQYLDETCRNLALLYNVETKTAWLLPEICVILHLIQSRSRFGRALISFPSFNDMRASQLKATCSGFLTSPSQDLSTTFKQFADAFAQMKEDILLRPRTSKRFPRCFTSVDRLAGVDFTDLASLPRTYTTREVDMTTGLSGNWVKMLKDNWEAERGYRVVSILCKNLSPEPIMPKAPGCGTWYPPPANSDYLITTMSCIRRLAARHGRDPVKLSPNYFWAPGKIDPYAICPKRNCDRLQKVTKKQPSRSMFAIMEKAPADSAVVFGGTFCMDPQMICQPASNCITASASLTNQQICRHI